MKFKVIRGIYFLLISFLLLMFFNQVVFLASGFRLFRILSSVLQMNYFQFRIVEGVESEFELRKALRKV